MADQMNDRVREVLELQGYSEDEIGAAITRMGEMTEDKARLLRLLEDTIGKDDEDMEGDGVRQYLKKWVTHCLIQDNPSLVKDFTFGDEEVAFRLAKLYEYLQHVEKHSALLWKIEHLFQDCLKILSLMAFDLDDSFDFIVRSGDTSHALWATMTKAHWESEIAKSVSESGQ